MKMVGSARWLKKSKAIAVASAIAISVPTAAIAMPLDTRIAQTNSASQNFSNNIYLYSFFQSQDILIPYLPIGLQIEEREQSIAAISQLICSDIANGSSVQAVHDTFMWSVHESTNGIEKMEYSAIQSAAWSYIGTAMNVGAAYHCPEYQAEITQVLNTL